MIPQEKILVVDDEADIREIIALCLKRDGYEIAEAGSAEEALEVLDPSFSLILLDIMMDGMNGYDLATRLRAEGNTIPIIFLTAKTTEGDMLRGFGSGADDYIKKPFSTKELSARVKSIITRSTLPVNTAAEVIQAGPLTIETKAKTVTVSGTSLSLTRTEYDILMLLIRHEGHTLTRTDILSAIWTDDKTVMERTVDVHIARLRRKLGDYAHIIANRVGFGYTFRPSEKRPGRKPSHPQVS